MSKVKDLIWSERYRPKTIDECILPKETINQVREFITAENIPNFLFCGSPGTGKTTLAKAICNMIGAEPLFINASNENGIDVLRTKIMQFASTVSFDNSKKVVILDEADYLNANSIQPAFRSFIEEFSNNCTFIFTCNYKNRIIEPLRSRLTVIDFKITNEEKMTMAGGMLKRVCKILEDEGVEYDKKVVAALITKHFPDFRKTILELQRYSISGKIDSGILTNLDEENFNVLLSSVKEKNFSAVRQWVANNNIEPTSFFRAFYDKATPKLIPQTIPQLILLIGEYQFRAAQSVDQEINAMAFLVEVMQQCQFKD